MKIKFIALCCFFTLCEPSYSQVATWLIWPEHERIYKERDADVLRTKSTDGTTILWSMNGEKIISTKDYVAPLHEGLAVVTEYRGNAPTTKIKGIYTEEGKYFPVSGDFALPNDVQTFFSGHLLVKDQHNYNVFRYMSPDGRVTSEMFEDARPFQNGYASCTTYERWDKKKGKYPVLLDKDMEHVKMICGGKEFDIDDISFISSVNDEGIGIVVADDKVFYFSGKSGSLTPLYADEQEANSKNQAEVKDALLSMNEYGNTVLKARTRKTNKEVSIAFDELLKPLAITSGQIIREFDKREYQKWKPRTSLKYTMDQNLYGIYYNDTIEVLPPQFKKVEAVYGNNAIVELQNGKYGMLKILGDKYFSLKLNDGEYIPFKHRRFKTVVYIDMPVEISPDNVRLITEINCGCNIDELTAERRKTEAGNRVQYQCSLNFPDSLPDEKNKLAYPVQIQYHGLVSPVMSLEAYAFHYKYFSLETSDVQVSKDGTAIFQLNINIPSTDDQNYPLQVRITSPDTLNTDIVSFNAFTYKCSVSLLKEGINNIELHVLEEGCPPVTLPFELTYTKPAPRKRESGKVSIIQKSKPKQEKFIPKT